MRNGHVHTIYRALFKNIEPINWQRERLEMQDGDFLDLDWYVHGNKKLVVLGHGLEGSSNSTYNWAAAHLCKLKGFDALAWNHRSCSGEMNRLHRFYHHGVSDDLHCVLQHIKGYDEVHYIGYSLGGNVLLKYLGEDWKNKPLKSAVAISTPIHLPGCVTEIHKRKNAIYHNRFLKSLLKKVEEKATLQPDFPLQNHRNIKTLIDFDDAYTAPLGGFENARDYHTKASSKPFIKHISIPTLLLQAEDDPLLDRSCMPYELAEESTKFHLLVTKYGGHVAFTQPGSKWHWMEEVALDFILKHSENN